MDPYQDDPTQATEIPPDDPGYRVGMVLDGRYRLLELIGQGGMGAVYRAEHVAIRRPIALKLLGPELAGVAELRRRFEREAIAIGRIEHPNCVAVQDFGALSDGSLYLTMEFLAGGSLAELVATEGHLVPRRALHIMRHVVRGLSHVHRAGIVHRDIKPENVVLVEHDGVPEFAKILDFGICRLLDSAGDAESELKLTQAGIAFGTPIYISPEQAVGEPAGPAADLYSATVVLYELITGRPPFEASDRMELLGLHVSRPPPALSVVAPELGLAPGLAALVARGLAKRPRERFTDADQYLAAIDELLSGPLPHDADIAPTPVSRSTPPPGPSYPLASSPGPLAVRPAAAARVSAVATRTWHWLRARPAAAVAAALGLAAMVILPTMCRGPDQVLLADTASPLASRAAASIEGGDPHAAIQTLSQPGARGDADAQLQLGHAHAARSEYRDALAAYGRTLALEPGLASDTTLRANLQLMYDDDGAVLVEAARLMAVHAGDSDALLRIVALAGHRDPDVRRAAASAADALGLADRIDRVPPAMLDLTQGKTCKARKDAVARLRALGDPRAIGALRDAATRKGRGRQGSNACLRQAAEDAARYLETVAPLPSPDAGSGGHPD